jgi:hypothetical protein
MFLSNALCTAIAAGTGGSGGVTSITRHCRGRKEGDPGGLLLKGGPDDIIIAVPLLGGNG